MSKIPFGLPLAALIALPFTTQAQTLDTAPVIVTATRIAQTADQALVPVSVITRKEIERSPASSLPELLNQLPGIDFSVSGGPGKNASLFLRGTNSTHTLVLIDGVRAGSATTGSFPFEQIPISQIERIEVVRGPRASLYGSDAIGGVVQIFTRKAHQGTQANLRAGAGNQNTREAQARLAWGDDQTSASLTAAYYKTNGIDAIDGINPDQDGYRNKSLGINLEHKLQENLAAEFTALRIESENHFDSRPAPADDYSDNLQQTLGLRLRGDVNDSWSLSGGINEHRDEAETFDAFGGFVNTKRTGAEIKSDHYFADQDLLTLGLDYYRDEVEKAGNDYDETSRRNQAVYGQWQSQFKKLSLLAGIRHDDNEAYGNHNTGNLNLGYQLHPRHRLLASYGTAFKAPNFNQLYWPGFSNPNLEPEESTSYELGYEGQAQGINYAIRGFLTEIDNLINTQPDNQEARIRGIELEAQTRLAQWQLAASATFLDAIDRETGDRLANRAERTLRANLNRSYGSLDWTFTFIAQGDRVSGGNTLPGYGLLNANVRYALAKQWSLEGKVHNLADKEYSSNADFLGRTYNGLDRTYLVSLIYQL